MYFEKVSIHLQGDLSFPLPPLHRVLQEFDHSHLSAPEIEASTRDALSFLKTENLSGKTIGITAGSRKIQNLEHILKQRARQKFLRVLELQKQPSGPK